ncbi:MAG: PhoU domain-containing protein [Romboutsia sp.]|uniref:PhoU domain-containing protein n=1 Tax=Romboutsia sp. TaxID=1965302 RepID=UPI003F3959A0
MNIAISLIGGLGLFLYGMSLMGEALQKSAGNKLKEIVELLTSNVLMGVLVGIVVTGIIQSSSATTVMVVGFGILFTGMEFMKDAVKPLADLDLANQVLEYEKEVNYLEKLFRKSHRDRLSESSCSLDSGVFYLGLLSNLERVSDHASNIAQQVLQIK